jgi:chromosome segregation ATPase
MELNVLISFLVIFNSLREEIEKEKGYIKDAESRMRLEMERVDKLTAEKFENLRKFDSLNTQIQVLSQDNANLNGNLDRSEKSVLFWRDKCNTLHDKIRKMKQKRNRKK